MSLTTVLFTSPTPPEATLRLTRSSTAVLGFIVGSYFASIIDSKFHSKLRGKLVISCVIRSILFLVIAVLLALLGWEGYPGLAMLFAVSARKEDDCPWDGHDLTSACIPLLLSSCPLIWQQWPSMHFDWEALHMPPLSSSLQVWQVSSVIPLYHSPSALLPRSEESASSA
jgi:hypothetical protein